MKNKLFSTIIILIISYFLFIYYSFSQSNSYGTASGIVKEDSTLKSLRSVNVTLVKLPDSTVIKGDITDSKGRFEIKDIPSGEYYLRFSQIGYSKNKSKIFMINSGNSKFDAGTVLLKISVANLDEIVVTSQKDLMNLDIDRKVYNVQQDILSQSGSVSELLANIPSVQVDVDGIVSLRGETNPQILINGKPSPMLAGGSADVLQQIPASSVEKIEVITNPSAKFKPEGSSGIINIVLKKDQGLGLNGTVGANIGNSSRYNINANLNYNPGNLNLYGTYSFRQDERNNYYGSRRLLIDSTNILSDSKDTTNAKSRPYVHFGSFGFDYKFSPDTKAGFSGNYRLRKYTSNDLTQYSVYENKIPIDIYDRTRVDFDYTLFSGFTTFYEHNFDGEEHNIRTELVYDHMYDQEDNRFKNTYAIPSDSIEFDNTLIREYGDNFEFTIDYHNELSKNSVLEAGFDGTFNKNDFPFYAEYLVPSSNQFIKDTTRTNHFRSDEGVYALYTTYENSFGNFGFLGGLRFEYARVTADLVDKNSLIINDYFKLYPTLHLTYKLNEYNQLQLNYSHRTNRPEDDDLNPFPEYRDPRNVSAGNPNLKPEFIHSLEFGCQFQSNDLSIVPSIFYRNKYNAFTRVTKALDNLVTLTTIENLATDQSGGVELVVSGNLGNFLTMNISGNGYYQQVDASNLGFSSKKSTWSWSSNLNLNFNLLKTTMLQINSNYRSKRLTPQGETHPSYTLNLGFRQDLFNNKFTMTGTITDLLETQKRETDLDTPALITNSVYRRDSRVLYLGLIYHFGMQKERGEKSLEFDENGQ